VTRDIRYDRLDDSFESRQTRLGQYRQLTRPVLEFYSQKELLVEVDAGADREALSQNLCALIAVPRKTTP